MVRFPPPAPAPKRALAWALSLPGLRGLQERAPGAYALAVNYHHTPSPVAANLARQLRWFADRFVPMGPGDLDALLRGEWPHDRPGIMVHFDDGFEDHATVAAPTLERQGFVGWFSIITDRVDAATRGQPDPDLAPEERSMTWGQARELSERGHAICSHTCTHARMRDSLTEEQVIREVVTSEERIVQELGAPSAGFCWPGGEMSAYDSRAMHHVLRCYARAFPSFTRPITPHTSPYAIARSNVEATWDLDVLALSIGRLWERKHRARAQDYHAKVREAAR